MYSCIFISRFTEIACKLIDLCVVIDSSGSIRDNNPSDGSYDNWELILDFVKEVLNFVIFIFFNLHEIQTNGDY